MKKSYYFLLIFGLIVADFATKSWIFNHLALYDGWQVTGWLNIVRVHNTGAAFGFLAGQDGWQLIFLSSLAIGVSVGIMYYLIKTSLKNTWLLLALSLIASGAIGNSIDREIYGYVVDFIDFHYQGYHFPAFNIADIAISMGAFCLIVEHFVSANKIKRARLV